MTDRQLAQLLILSAMLREVKRRQMEGWSPDDDEEGEEDNED